MKSMMNKTRNVTLILIPILILSFFALESRPVLADVHYDSWTSWTYKTLTPGQQFNDETADGRYSTAGHDYCGVEYELVTISPSPDYSIWRNFYWCDGIPNEYWPIGTYNPTYPNGGILHIHLQNTFPLTTVQVKYRWRLMWQDV